MINLYSTGCPKCKILEMKLNQKNIKFNEISDLDVLISKNILNVPVLEVDGTLYDFPKAVAFINNYNTNDMRGEDYGYRF